MLSDHISFFFFGVVGLIQATPQHSALCLWLATDRPHNLLQGRFQTTRGHFSRTKIFLHPSPNTLVKIKGECGIYKAKTSENNLIKDSKMDKTDREKMWRICEREKKGRIKRSQQNNITQIHKLLNFMSKVGKKEDRVTLIIKEGAEYSGRGWPVKVPVLPRVTSQGELIGCCGPSAPPSLSVPCTPVPAKVETFPSERLIWRRRRKSNQILLRTDTSGSMTTFFPSTNQSESGLEMPAGELAWPDSADLPF